MKRARSIDSEAVEEPLEKKVKILEVDAQKPSVPASLSYSLRVGGVQEQVSFQQPQQILTFSYTPQHTLEFSDSALRYYVQPPAGADLRYGYDRWIKRPEEKGRLDSLLRAISRTRLRIDSGGMNWLRTIGIISWRGVMTKILTAPYEERDGWELNVMLLDGTLYFEEHSSDARLAERNNLTPNQRLQSYYGYSFESYCTSTSPTKPTLPSNVAGWGGDVDTNVQWCSVVKTKLSDTRLLIGGEVDCVRGKYTGKPDAFVELKTSLTIRHAQDEARFEKKLLKFYFQSFLLGVPEIVVGFRSPQGRLGTVQTFKTVEIPRMVRGKPGAWDPTRCLDWANRFISFVKSMVTPVSGGHEIDDVPVWRVKFNPGSGVIISRLNSDGVNEVRAGDERVGFLPKWYVDELGLDAPSPDPATSATPVVPLDSVLPSGWQI